MISVEDSGSRVDQNSTYIRNPNYPSAIDDITTTTYTIAKYDNGETELKIFTFITKLAN